MKQRTHIRLGTFSVELQTEGVVSIVAMLGIAAIFLALILVVYALRVHA